VQLLLEVGADFSFFHGATPYPSWRGPCAKRSSASLDYGSFASPAAAGSTQDDNPLLVAAVSF